MSCSCLLPFAKAALLGSLQQNWKIVLSISSENHYFFLKMYNVELYQEIQFTKKAAAALTRWSGPFEKRFCEDAWLWKWGNTYGFVDVLNTAARCPPASPLEGWRARAAAQAQHDWWHSHSFRQWEDASWFCPFWGSSRVPEAASHKNL